MSNFVNDMPRLIETITLDLPKLAVPANSHSDNLIRGSITMKISMVSPGMQTIDMLPLTEEAVAVTFEGTIEYRRKRSWKKFCGAWDSKCEDFEMFWKNVPEVMELCKYWKRYSGNAFNMGGTRRQQAYVLREYETDSQTPYYRGIHGLSHRPHYEWVVRRLEDADLIVDRGHDYKSRNRLYRPIPPQFFKRMASIMKMDMKDRDGTIAGRAPDIGLVGRAVGQRGYGFETQKTAFGWG